MKIYKKPFALLLTLAFLIGGGARTMATQAKANDSQGTATLEFALKVLPQLQKVEPGKNIFISPTSIAIALAMALNGAEGETRAAISRTLGLETLTPDQIERQFADFFKQIQSADPKVKLRIANSLWARQDIHVRESFIKAMRETFGAQIARLDFNSPEAVETINGWVSEQTEGKIAKIVSSIDPQDALFLINAIYFKGRWQEPFDPKRTKEAPFHLAGGGTKNVMMMSQSDSYRFLEGEGFQAVSLPYGEGRLSMNIFLPDEKQTLADFLKKLTADNWKQWLSRFETMDGTIEIPRFKLEYESELKDLLTTLGMGVAFDPHHADFSKMIESPPSAFISEVMHKTFVEVNEEGTEAAAATSVRIGLTSVRKTFRLTVNRPFFCVIRDNQTGALLFMGVIWEP